MKWGTPDMLSGGVCLVQEICKRNFASGENGEDNRQFGGNNLRITIRILLILVARISE